MIPKCVFALRSIPGHCRHPPENTYITIRTRMNPTHIKHLFDDFVHGIFEVNDLPVDTCNEHHAKYCCVFFRLLPSRCYAIHTVICTGRQCPTQASSKTVAPHYANAMCLDRQHCPSQKTKRAQPNCVRVCVCKCCMLYCMVMLHAMHVLIGGMQVYRYVDTTVSNACYTRCARSCIILTRAR